MPTEPVKLLIRESIPPQQIYKGRFGHGLIFIQVSQLDVATKCLLIEAMLIGQYPAKGCIPIVFCIAISTVLIATELLLQKLLIQ